MNWDELRGIAAHPLVTISGHTVNHAISSASEADARHESAGAGILRRNWASSRHSLIPTAGRRRTSGLARDAGYAPR
jgi:hypothetical protein